jgi:hypothetical protein
MMLGGWIQSQLVAGWEKDRLKDGIEKNYAG